MTEGYAALEPASLAEAREFADSVPITDAPPHIEASLAADCDGMLFCRPLADDEWGFWGYRKPRLTDPAAFDRWARQRFYVLRLAGHPEKDGWRADRTNGGWCMVGRRAAPMPPDPFPEL